MEITTMNRVNPVLIWKFDFMNDTCPICQHSLMGPSPTCNNENKPIESSAPIKGKCNHVFHSDCMKQWLQNRYRAKCPLCSIKWETQSYDYPESKKCSALPLPENDISSDNGLSSYGGRL